MSTITYSDGTVYYVQRLGHGWQCPKWKVSCKYHRAFPLYADNETHAIEKAREIYAKEILGL